MIKRDLGHGFYAVPRGVVTENGLPSVQLNTQEEPYSGGWCLIAPNGYAVDSEYNRPYRYANLQQATDDVAEFVERGECSTCGGVVKLPQEPPASQWNGIHRVTLQNGQTLKLMESENSLYVALTTDRGFDAYICKIGADGVTVYAVSDNAPGVLTAGLKGKP